MTKRLLCSEIRSVVACTSLILGFSTQATGQVTSNNNQIEGIVEFTNTDPTILNVLNSSGADEGIVRVFVFATSIGISPPLFNSTNMFTTVRTNTPYQISVEAGPAANGIPYDVRVDARLDSRVDQYLFAPLASAPVVEEPAPNVTLNFSECAALLDIRWETLEGTPVAVNGGNIIADRETSPGAGSFSLQARSLNFTAGSSQEYLAVRGDGSTYEVDIFYDVGTDPFSDKIRLLHEATIQASCDQIVPITCIVPEIGGNELGEIFGNVDILGQDLLRLSDRTLILAEQGPFENRRLDTVDVPTPSEGPFLLENLVPSDATSPPTGYQVWADMFFGQGRGFKYVSTPRLDEFSNGRVIVPAGQQVDLEDTFVLDPGFVSGKIFLTGPPPGPFNCLQDISRNPDSNGDGIPDSIFLTGGSSVEAVGLQTPATGANLSASGGLARVDFEGGFDPVLGDFLGDYRLVLGGLSQENSLWRIRFTLSFRNTDTPEVPQSYLRSAMNISDRDTQELEIVPGQTINAPIRLCFGQLNLSFLSTATATNFFEPRFSGNGSFSGLDFENNQADYAVALNAVGTPTDQATAAAQGLVVGCLPEATYNLTPFVTSVNPDGGLSVTQLFPVLDVEIECGQIKNLTLGLEVKLDSLAPCTAEPTATLSGSAEGTGEAPVSVDRISATVNDGPEVLFCEDCGQDPSYQFDVPLQECDNRIEVTARDEFDNLSSTIASTRFDNRGPVLQGCQDISVGNDSGTSGATVDFEVTSTDNCDGDRPVICDRPSGSFFAQGLSEVTCSATDACGNQSSCLFTVSVCQAVEPDVRTQGFWKRQCKGPHPSGEHDNLPAYVGQVNLYETFLAVQDVNGLCERLHPAPKNDKCEQAEAQFMAASLNLASGRVAACNCLDDPDLGSTTVGEALSFIDGLLSSPGRVFGDCILAQAIADRLNNGETLSVCAP